ncbi:MAG: TRAM domain-containing protein [Nitrososphaerales archaeon]
MSYGNRNRGYGGGSGGGGGGGGYGGGRDRGFGGSSMNQGPKPVEVGKEYNVEITELSRRGDGVAKMQGFVIFVKGARMGDKVKIKIESVGPRFATATALEPSTGKTEGEGAPAASDAKSSDSSFTESVE